MLCLFFTWQQAGRSEYLKDLCVGGQCGQCDILAPAPWNTRKQSMWEREMYVSRSPSTDNEGQDRADNDRETRANNTAKAKILID